MEVNVEEHECKKKWLSSAGEMRLLDGQCFYPVGGGLSEDLCAKLYI